MTTDPTNSLPNSEILRILDAAINRTGEGLRVVEDFTRMILNDSHLTERLKVLRHDFVRVTNQLDFASLISLRDTEGDVGTSISVASEYQRETTASLVQANLSRVQQSLRTIEEYSKALSPSLARQIEPIRYACYTLEKAIMTTLLSSQVLKDARLYVLIDGGKSECEFRESVRKLVSGGVDLIQLREKALSDRSILARSAILRDEIHGHPVRWIMNDRPDLAVAARADGVHLGQDDIPVAEARRIVGPTKMIGVSTHSLEQAREAVLAGANYIGVGPVFPSQTKSFDQFVGLELVRQVASEISLPAFAIGGVHESNLAQIVEAGLSRVVVSGAIHRDSDQTRAVKTLREKLSQLAASA